jgi:replicative DNA helicase
MKTLYDQVDALFKFAESPVKRVGTGIKEIDALIGGPAPGEICMIMARSYAGKSIVGQNIIHNNKELPSIFFSMEMPYMQAIMRLYSMWSNTPAANNQHALEAGHLDKDVWDMVLAFPNHYIDDRSALTLEEMSLTIQKYEDFHKFRPEFVVVDYLELLGGAKASGDGFSAVESQATMLKDWAKQEEMRVFVLHQTNRQEPKWKPPTENSPRFGGYTEADFVVGLWRPHCDPDLPYWDSMAIEHYMHFNVLKNRAFFKEKALIEMKITPSLRITSD